MFLILLVIYQYKPTKPLILIYQLAIKLYCLTSKPLILLNGN